MIRNQTQGVGSLRFQDVTKSFDAPLKRAHPVAVLNGVTFEVKSGEAVGIIGVNGAGKSTILRLAAGVSAPSAGLISRTGRTVSVIELGAGMHPDLTGRENVRLLASLATGQTATRSEVLDEIARFAELADVLDVPTRQYSTGMVARLAFSVATHSRPDLLLIDEVLSVGDLAFQQRCKTRIEELNAEGTTVVLVSHDMDLLYNMCDRVLLIAGGVVQEDGPSRQVIGRYLGHPDRVEGHPDLSVRLREPKVRTGTAAILDIAVAAKRSGRRVRLDLVVPMPAAVGENVFITCGSAYFAPVPPDRFAVKLATDNLPSGRYELVATVEASDGDSLTQRVPLAIAGAPGPFVLRLGASWVLDGQQVEQNRESGELRVL